MTDFYGRVVGIYRSDAKEYYTFDFSGISSGMYILTIKDNYRIITRTKVIKK
ncbi:MAG: T9SS type A sorting domain-containing protein [Bacteroidia bacterium]|nr:T9SS type A sorting domain-containing protein [Bacteroidia bacterium]